MILGQRRSLTAAPSCLKGKKHGCSSRSVAHKVSRGSCHEKKEGGAGKGEGS